MLESFVITVFTKNKRQTSLMNTLQIHFVYNYFISTLGQQLLNNHITSTLLHIHNKLFALLFSRCHPRYLKFKLLIRKLGYAQLFEFCIYKTRSPVSRYISAPNQIHKFLLTTHHHSISILMETICFPGTIANPRILGSSFSSSKKDIIKH